MPHVAVMNKSTAIADEDIQKMIPAFSHQWNKDLAPVWGIDAAAFGFVPAKHSPATGAWWVVFLDDSDSADALAYHDLTDEGLPISKVFVKTLRADRSSISASLRRSVSCICLSALTSSCATTTRSGPAETTRDRRSSKLRVSPPNSRV